jgi:hypothetical protein
MDRRHHLARAMAALLIVASLLGAGAPAAAAASAAQPAAAQPSSTAQLSDFGEPFHFLAPLGVEAGDPANFDSSLLDELIVTICRVDAGTCTPVKTLTSASALSERLRIGQTNGKDSYYLANWDVSKLKLAPYTFRVTVTVDRLQLGSIDVGPATYKSFGRTWPIKFRVENNPTIRVRVLHEAGKSAGQVANAIRLEFGLCGDDLAQLLANDLDPFEQDDIDLAIAGVCQAAEIPATTKVADPATQDALTAFDPTTGQMTFSGSTPTLASLKTGDVLVGEPAAAAANGYLRKVTSITKNKKTGVITLGTTQAKIDEAINAGTLDAQGDLEAADIQSTEALQGVTLREAQPTAARFGAIDTGGDYAFHESIDITIDGSTSSGAVSGNGTIHITGDMNYNAGFDIGLGVETCAALPPVCVDRFETHIGAKVNSNLHVEGTFDGHLVKEVVLSTHYFKPIIFFIGPIPVVIVPIVKAIAGVSGDAHVEFTFDAKVTSGVELGAKWTDPDDGGVGWEDLNKWPPTITGPVDAEASASMDLRAYAKADAKLLFYGIAGPGFAGNVGLWGHVEFPGTPHWIIYGIAQGELSFSVDLGGVLTLADHRAQLPEFSFELGRADNEPPTCSGRTDPIPVAPNVEVYLGPRTTGNWQGYFACADPEGGDVVVTGKEGSTTINLSAAKWSSGDHDVVVTAEDEDGLVSDPFTLHVHVVDTPPILSVTSSGTSVPASVQYFVTASAWDVEGGEAYHNGAFVPCTSMAWEVTGGSASKAISNQTCTVSVVFTQTGFQTVKVTATDFGGKTSDQTVTVFVTAAPANAAPVIDMDNFDVMAASGPKVGCSPGPLDCHESCPSGFFCMVPMDSILYNGTVGDFHPPLTLSVEASDPNGDPLTITWHCQVGSYNYEPTPNGDGTFDCSPYSSTITTPILVWAEVSDGTTTVRTEVRRLYMLDRLV